MKFFNLYLICINVFSFVICGIDKSLAKQSKSRISEKTLFFVSFIGGSAGMFLGMQLFRHKTQKIKFIIGIPLIFLVEFVICAIISQFF